MIARLQSMLERELEKGERVIWSGQPDPVQAARGGLSFGVPGAFLMALAAGWNSLVGSLLPAVAGTTPVFDLIQVLFHAMFFLGGLLLVLLGAAFFSIPVWIWRRARATLYVVTSRRCLILVAEWPEAAQGYGHAHLVSVERVEHAPGRSDLVLVIREEPGAALRWRGFADLLRRVELPKNQHGHRIAFRGISEANVAERLLLEFQDRKLAMR
ncbi:MAG TPA: hypothetical protein VG457_04655 [Planctomycetota bacterium]|nr:hypothetical protein [Planctomycetota bacterium]